MKARTCTCLLAVVAALPASCESTENNVRVVKIPRSPFFVFGHRKDAPELDRLFQDLKGGEKFVLELVFPGQDGQILRSGPVMVRKGSLTIRNEKGYFRIFPEGRVLAKTAGLPEKEFTFEEAPPGLFLWAIAPQTRMDDGPVVTLSLAHTPIDDPEKRQLVIEKSTSRAMKEAGYNDHSLAVRSRNGWRVRMTIEASADFEGSIGEWHVGPVGK